MSDGLSGGLGDAGGEGRAASDGLPGPAYRVWAPTGIPEVQQGTIWPS